MAIEVKVPDIGDFKDVPVIEVHVQAGARVKAEDPLITLESDKATMDVPAPQAGTVAEVKVAVGDRVAEGALILLLEPELHLGPHVIVPDLAGWRRERMPQIRIDRADFDLDGDVLVGATASTIWLRTMVSSGAKPSISTRAEAEMRSPVATSSPGTTV